MLITVTYGRLCLPEEILTVAQTPKRGLLLEVKSNRGKVYPMLLKNGKNHLFAVHKCFAVSKGNPCKHLRTAIHLAEKWLDRKLPKKIEVDIRWLEAKELVAVKDLTQILLNKPGAFEFIKKEAAS